MEPGAKPHHSLAEWLKGWQTGRLLNLSQAQSRTARYLAALGILGAALMIFGPGTQKADRQQGSAEPVTAGAVGSAAVTSVVAPDEESPGAAKQLERELTATLAQMAGVGDVKVLVTLETGSERVYAMDTSSDRRTTDETDKSGGRRRVEEQTNNARPVLARDDDGKREAPILIVERYPRVRGVVVVADGAGSPTVRLAITRAVSSALNLPSYRVTVVPKKG